MTNTRFLSAIILMTILTGCVTQATYDGRTFGSPAEALLYQASKYDEAIRSLEPLNEPILEYGAFFSASRTLIDQYNRQQNPNLQPWQHNFFTDSVETDGRKIYQALVRKNIFQKLEYIPSNGIKPDASKYDAIVYLYWPELSTSGYFFECPAFRHEPIPISKGFSTWNERLERWLLNIKALSQAC